MIPAVTKQQDHSLRTPEAVRAAGRDQQARAALIWQNPQATGQRLPPSRRFAGAGLVASFVIALASYLRARDFHLAWALTYFSGGSRAGDGPWLTTALSAERPPALTTSIRPATDPAAVTVNQTCAAAKAAAQGYVGRWPSVYLCIASARPERPVISSRVECVIGITRALAAGR